MNILANLEKIRSQWFYTEPLLFSAACTHNFMENNSLSVPLRSGCMRIEFSSELCNGFNQKELEDLLKIEIFRILMQHPYKRKPLNAKGGILSLASDIVLYQGGIKLSSINSDRFLQGVEYFKFQAKRFEIEQYPLGKKWEGSEELNFFKRNLCVDHRSGILVLKDVLSFEQWYQKISFLVEQTSIAGSQNVGASSNGQSFSLPSDESCELWQENPDAQSLLSMQIQKAQTDMGWGGLSGGEIRTLEERCDFSFDYRRALSRFRQRVVSAKRSLTRMRPSRRFGFSQMGSRYERKANVLIAVDVSGSITDCSFEKFCHAVKNFFFLGIIENIDLIFFDTQVKFKEPVPLKKNMRLDQVNGRGGTNFQCALDFFLQKKAKYSGMIIFTDGEGEKPSANEKMNVLWILESRLSYEKSKLWIKSLPGHNATYLT